MHCHPELPGKKKTHASHGERCHPDSNWGIKVLQTLALPLGYGTKERAVDGIRTRDIHLGKVALYQLSYYRISAPEKDADEET